MPATPIFLIKRETKSAEKREAMTIINTTYYYILKFVKTKP